jgi:hypothetical protein
MRTHSNESNQFHKLRTPTGETLVNPNANRLRLNSEQRMFYTELFNENASNGKVKRENFLPLLGIFGTKIAQDFSDRMFLVLSKGEQEITLDQYLNYIDTYHYGDIHERCLYTCKLMDTKQKGKIELEDFQSYINLIINTVKKVNNTLTKKDLMSEKDIEMLFYHISKGEPFFTYTDFEVIYQEKPELVSWFDYFKNDKEDILIIIHEFVPIILKVFNDFICNFINDLFLLLDKEKEINLDLIFQKVLNYSNKLEKIFNSFMKKVSKFNITNAFYNLNKQNNKGKLEFDLPHNLESNYNKINKNDDNNNNDNNNNCFKNDNIDAFFKEIKKSIYQKDEKEFVLENKNIKYPKYKNDTKYYAEKFLKRSNNFRNKNFKFYDEYSYTKNPKNNNIFRRNSSLNNNNVKNYLNNQVNVYNSIDNFRPNINQNNNEINNINITNSLNNVYMNNYHNNYLNQNNYKIIYTIPYENFNQNYAYEDINNINNYNYYYYPNNFNNNINNNANINKINNINNINNLKEKEVNEIKIEPKQKENNLKNIYKATKNINKAYNNTFNIIKNYPLNNSNYDFISKEYIKLLDEHNKKIKTYQLFSFYLIFKENSDYYLKRKSFIEWKKNNKIFKHLYKKHIKSYDDHCISCSCEEEINEQTNCFNCNCSEIEEKLKNILIRHKFLKEINPIKYYLFLWNKKCYS